MSIDFPLGHLSIHLQVPPIKVVVYNDASKQYCGQEPVLGGGKALAAGYWAKINIPMDAFK